MHGNRLIATAFALIVSVAHPTALLGQESAAPETYNGVPLCQNRRGVFPKRIYTPDPDYDDKARKKRTQGVVVLSTVVTTDGGTADTKVTRTLTPGLDKQAIKAVSRWTFEPVIQDGQPCPMRINIEVQFRLY